MVDRAAQIQVDARLQHIAVRAAVDCRGDEFVVAVHRQEDDSRFGAVAPEPLECPKAVELRHCDIQDGNVRAEAHRLVERLMAVAGKGDDVERRRKKNADFFQKPVVIVREEDAGPGRGRDVHVRGCSLEDAGRASYTKQRHRGGTATFPEGVTSCIADCTGSA